MTTPVPGASVGTRYGARGRFWSCRRDSAGNGIHTGVDYPAPAGTAVVAARPGKVVYSSHGSAFGSHQIDVICSDGTRDFYAHMSSRAVSNGATVAAGQRIGSVGTEGNSTGPHLHFERHATTTGGWSCAVVRDPQPSIDYASKVGPPRRSPYASGTVYVDKLVQTTRNSDSVSRLCYRLMHHKKVPKTKRPSKQSNDYGAQLAEAVAYWQRKVRPDVKGPSDGSSMSNAQANAIFGSRYTVVEK
jgi:murein DD-endopeptidase MepM/ murein hydrolase activator NlpD